MARPSGSPPDQPEEEAVEPVISPTVIHRGLTTTLKLLRKQAGLHQSDVGDALGWSHGKVGHIETRHVKLRIEDVRLLLQLYEVPAEEQERYLYFTKRAREKGWWDGAPGVPSWFMIFIGLEWGASSCATFSLGYVPGLLQTKRYARAVLNDGVIPDHDLEDQLGQRLRRQQVLTRPNRPLQLHAILDESVLHRHVGGPEVMHEQLVSLSSQIRHSLSGSPSQSSNLRLQVLPLSAGEHRGQLGSFTHLRFPHDEDVDADDATVKLREQLDPGIVYFENQFGGVYLDEQEKADRAAEIHADLASRSLKPEESADLIDDLAKKTGV